MIQTRNLGRDYSQGTRTLSVLSDITLEIGAGEFVAVTGPSGSGKRRSGSPVRVWLICEAPV